MIDKPENISSEQIMKACWVKELGAAENQGYVKICILDEAPESLYRRCGAKNKEMRLELGKPDRRLFE